MGQKYSRIAFLTYQSCPTKQAYAQNYRGIPTCKDYGKFTIVSQNRSARRFNEPHPFLLAQNFQHGDQPPHWKCALPVLTLNIYFKVFTLIELHR